MLLIYSNLLSTPGLFCAVLPVDLGLHGKPGKGTAIIYSGTYNPYDSVYLF